MLRAAVVIALLAAKATAQEGTSNLLNAGERYERFQLYNHCRPLFLVIEPPDNDAADIGLTGRGILNAVESRLRGARLHTDSMKRSNGAYLYINITVMKVASSTKGAAFSILIGYFKSLADPASGELGLATAWFSTSTGMTNRSGAGFILQGLAGHLDKFLAAYLRVNEEDCGGP